MLSSYEFGLVEYVLDDFVLAFPLAIASCIFFFYNLLFFVTIHVIF